MVAREVHGAVPLDCYVGVFAFDFYLRPQWSRIRAATTGTVVHTSSHRHEYERNATPCSPMGLSNGHSDRVVVNESQTEPIRLPPFRRWRRDGILIGCGSWLAVQKIPSSVSAVQNGREIVCSFI